MADRLTADLALIAVSRDDGGMSKLTVQRFDIPGPALITPARHGDERGWFSEIWNASDWASAGLPKTDWVQDNEAFTSAPGTIRGLHFQAPPHAQAKLVRVIEGVIFDVAVDIRDGSRTFGQAVTVTLSAQSGDMLYVPRGFAHGYQTAAKDTRVAYKCDNLYAPEAEGGLRWNAPGLNIDWPVTANAQVNDRDAKFPRLGDLNSPFVWTN